MREGHLRQRSAGSWEIKYEAGQDPTTGKRRTRFETIKGTKRDAQRELRRLLQQVDEGMFADAGKLSLGQYLDHWLAGHRATVSPRTAERYAEHIEKNIEPSIGDPALAKVSTLHLNTFYADKLATGCLDGRGGLSAQTVRHLDRVLHTALRDSVRGRPIAINPVAEAKRPKVAQVRAGHSSIAVTMDVYSHATASLQRDATERMQAAFENIQASSGGNRVAKALSGSKGSVVKL